MLEDQTEYLVQGFFRGGQVFDRECHAEFRARTKSDGNGVPSQASLPESVEKCFCHPEIGCVEPFGESVVDRLKEGQRLRGTALIAQQPGETRRGAQFP